MTDYTYQTLNTWKRCKWFIGQ